MKGEINSSLTNMILLENEATTFFRGLGEKPILSPQQVASHTASEAQQWSCSTLWTGLLNH